MVYVRCINCSYNNMAKGICLLDKKAIFVYTGKFHTSKSFFDSHILLTYQLIDSKSDQSNKRGVRPNTACGLLLLMVVGT